ncbi:MAG: hypothetical protein OXC13_19760 [Caldilineaceae bacterium]|nr:hypothetical protein [Caldilineaceae bacterium]
MSTVEWAEVHFPEAEQIVLVCDNVNTHTLKSQAFGKETAGRLVARFKQHYNATPRPLAQQGRMRAERPGSPVRLNRRFAKPATLAAETAAWCRCGNAHPQPLRWRCTTADARLKLHHLYPSS